MSEDRELLRRYTQEHSQAAFAALVQRYLNLVYSVALRKSGGDSHRAEEISQLVFVRLAERASSLAHYTVLSGWLYTVAHNLAATAARDDFRRRRRETAALFHQEIMNNEPAPDWTALRPVLDDAMQRLGRADRDAVLLRYFENCGYAQIAQRLGLSESGARMRVERALGKLNSLLTRRGVGSSMAALATLLTNHSVVAAPAYLAETVTGASAAVSTPALVKLLVFMGTTKTTVGIIAASLLLLGVGGYQWQQTVRERGELNSKLNQIQAQRALAAKLRDEAAVVDRASAKPGGNVRAVATFRPPSTTEIYDQAEATYPEIKVMLANVNRALLNRFLGGYVARAGLSEAQRNALYAAELDAIEKRHLISFADSSEPSDFQLPHEQLVAIVGEAAAAQFDGYIQRLPAEKVVAEAALKAGMAGVPLSTDQQDRFAQVIAAAAKLDSNNPTPDFAGMDLQSVMGQSAGFLNSEQLAAVKGALTQAQFSETIRRATQAQSQGKAVATDKP